MLIKGKLISKGDEYDLKQITFLWEREAQLKVVTEKLKYFLNFFLKILPFLKVFLQPLYCNLMSCKYHHSDFFVTPHFVGLIHCKDQYLPFVELTHQN